MFMASIGLMDIFDFMYTKTKPAPEPIITISITESLLN